MAIELREILHQWADRMVRVEGIEGILGERGRK